MVRINRVYTKKGDRGETSLACGRRVSKASARIAAYGTVDELNAVIGLVCTALADSAAGTVLSPILHRIQNELFNLGAQLATADEARRQRSPALELRHVEALEKECDDFNEELPALKSFILPGGGWASSYFHLARTICRRAERAVVELATRESVGDLSLAYLNRLSDALFVFGRWAAVKDGKPEPLWEPDKT